MGHNHNTLITKYQYNIRILTIYENNKKYIYILLHSSTILYLLNYIKSNNKLPQIKM